MQQAHALFVVWHKRRSLLNMVEQLAVHFLGGKKKKKVGRGSEMMDWRRTKNKKRKRRSNVQHAEKYIKLLLIIVSARFNLIRRAIYCTPLCYFSLACDCWKGVRVFFQERLPRRVLYGATDTRVLNSVIDKILGGEGERKLTEILCAVHVRRWTTRPRESESSFLSERFPIA